MNKLFSPVQFCLYAVIGVLLMLNLIDIKGSFFIFVTSSLITLGAITLSGAFNYISCLQGDHGDGWVVRWSSKLTWKYVIINSRKLKSVTLLDR